MYARAYGEGGGGVNGVWGYVCVCVFMYGGGISADIIYGEKRLKGELRKRGKSGKKKGRKRKYKGKRKIKGQKKFKRSGKRPKGCIL